MTEATRLISQILMASARIGDANSVAEIQAEVTTLVALFARLRRLEQRKRLPAPKG